MDLPCPPRWGTPRDPSRPTLGPAMGAVARLLGKPLLPWAQYVADVSLEIDPTTGLLWYREVNVLTPRQSTKSTLLLVKNVHRATATDQFGPRQRLVYTAQTRNDAREKWEDDFVATLQASSAFKNRIRVSYANGRERILFSNGSTLGIDATTETSGHGSTLDGTDIDEGFSRVDNRTEQAARPAMITRPQPQLWVASTGGWLGGSPYLWDKVETGREIVRLNEPSRRCYFEWGAPDDADADDREAWKACMPGLLCNGGIISLEAIENEYAEAVRQGKLNEFRRAYLNQWVDQFAADESPINEQRWAALTDPYASRLEPVAFGVHVTPDRSATMIGVAGRRADGLIQVELAVQQAGTDWALPWLIERASRWLPCAITLDGTALALEATLADAKVTAYPTNSTDRAQATVDFYDAVCPSPESGEKATVRHLGDPVLTTAVKAARKRVINQRWVWEGDNAIGPLVAVTLAHHGLLAHERPAPRPATPLLAGGLDSAGTVAGGEIDLRSVMF